MTKYAVGIQVRSNSRRFPGKSLQNIQGIPLIAWVVESCLRISLPVWVLTSKEASDDCLAKTSERYGAGVFRGSLTNVFGRYRAFSEKYEFTHIMRINGDSPLISPEIMLESLKVHSIDCTTDLVTNVFPRTFPKGQSVEIINCLTLQKIPQEKLSDNNNEHLTSYIYENESKYRINNFKNTIDMSYVNLCVDSPSDLMRIEGFLAKNRITSPSKLPEWAELSRLIQESRIWS